MTMAFALCPDGGLPRLWRFVDDDRTMTEGCIVSALYPEYNLLVVNRVLFDQLPELDRHRVLRTQKAREYI